MANYQVEYQLNGVPSSFEFYLFVNPLGKKCYKSEQELIHCLNHISSKVDVNILTYHNHDALYNFLDQLDFDDYPLSLRNHYYQVVYKSSIAYKAATLQGRKLGRQYLIRLQEVFNEDVENFSDSVLFEIAKEVGLDLQIFKHDFNSDFVRQLFLKDQKIAREMQIEYTPALVIFQNEFEEDGIIIREHITKEKILEELTCFMEHYYHSSKLEDSPPAKLSIIHRKEK